MTNSSATCSPDFYNMGSIQPEGHFKDWHCNAWSNPNPNHFDYSLGGICCCFDYSTLAAAVSASTLSFFILVIRIHCSFLLSCHLYYKEAYLISINSGQNKCIYAVIQHLHLQRSLFLFWWCGWVFYRDCCNRYSGLTLIMTVLKLLLFKCICSASAFTFAEIFIFILMVWLSVLWRLFQQVFRFKPNYDCAEIVII